MSNFKSGSGNLSFGDDDEDEEESESENPQTKATSEEAEAQPGSNVDPETANSAPPTEDSSGDRADQSTTSTSNSSPTESVESPYPYFVRRNNVGDERDKRLEIHVREQIADEEGQFRNQLAEILDTNEISKTDAREFALLAAFQHPEQVAKLMREEGFGAVN